MVFAVDGSGNVYVADAGNTRIQKFTSDGIFISKWGSYGHGDDQFISILGLGVDGVGIVYVLDYLNNRIQKFTSDGLLFPNGMFGSVQVLLMIPLC